MMEEKILTPMKAIRAYCLGCCFGSADEVRMCTIHNCELYPYRFGKNPNRKGLNLTEEQREAKRELARSLHKYKDKITQER